MISLTRILDFGEKSDDHSTISAWISTNIRIQRIVVTDSTHTNRQRVTDLRQKDDFRNELISNSWRILSAHVIYIYIEMTSFFSRS